MNQPQPAPSDAASPAPTPGSPPRRRLRWTIRTLLILTALAAVLLAWIGRTVRVGHSRLAVISALDEAGAAVYSPLNDNIEPKWHEIILGNWESIEAGFLHTTAPDAKVNDDLLLKAACFRKLESVSLDGQRITDRGIAALRNQTKLTQLSIRGCNVGDAAMSHLATLENLEQLDLYGVRVTAKGVRQLSSLAKLKSLQLHFTLVAKHEIADLRQSLPQCDISYIPSTSEAEVHAVIELAQLGGVVARDPESMDTSITVHRYGDPSLVEWKLLEAFPDLETFVIFAVPAKTGLVRQLATHRRLASVTFVDTPTSAADLKLLAACPKLRSLRLTGIDVTDEHLVAAGRISTLEELKIFGNYNLVSRSGIDALTVLKGLKVLELNRVDLVDSDLQKLPLLENLEVVAFSNTPLTDASLDYILSLPKLRMLTLDNTKITGSGAQKIMECPSIAFADWYGTGILPESFSRSRAANSP